MKDQAEQVPVEKTRMKTLYRDKLIYRDEIKKRLNQAKYDNSYKEITNKIEAKEK